MYSWNGFNGMNHVHVFFIMFFIFIFYYWIIILWGFPEQQHYICPYRCHASVNVICCLVRHRAVVLLALPCGALGGAGLLLMFWHRGMCLWAGPGANLRPQWGQDTYSGLRSHTGCGSGSRPWRMVWMKAWCFCRHVLFLGCGWRHQRRVNIIIHLKQTESNIKYLNHIIQCNTMMIER